MFYIQQIQNDDCGFACLKMLLAEINKDKDYLFLPQDEKHGPYSLMQLVGIASNYGVALSAFRATDKTTVSNCLNFPFIAIIRLKNGGKHAVLVKRASKHRVIYIDPRCGKVSVSLNRFVTIWDGAGLMIDNYEKRKCPVKPIEPISVWNKIVLGLVQFIAGVFVVLGIYFLNDSTPIYYSIIFLSLAVVSEIIIRIISYSLMKKIDKYFFDEKRIPNQGFKDYLFRFEEYKKLSLSSPMNYILSLVFALGLVAVVILNDYRNAIIIATSIILSLVEVFIFSPLLNRKKKEIGDLEDNIDSASCVEDFKEKINRLHRSVYRYSYADTISSYAIALVMLAMVMLTMYLSGISSLPYIIFYTCICFALFKTTNQLFSFSDKVMEFNKVKIRISNRIKNHE